MDFFEKLAIASQKNNSLLCVGLDPDLNMIPSTSMVALNDHIIEATIDLACAYKLNLAIYESMGIDGLLALKVTLDIIRKANPNIPIIGDGKRGDIGLCSHAYTRALFDTYEFDAITVNPYMGLDALKPFLDRKDKGVFVLCRTSNPSGMDIQELMVNQKGSSIIRPLYEIVAELALTKWNENGNVGLVIGATYPEQLYRIRQICPDMLFLIPGVGFQGGNIEKTVHSAVNSKGKGLIINVSRQIMYAAKTPKNTQRKPKEAVKNMHSAALHIRDEINRYLPKPIKESQEKISKEIIDRIDILDKSQEEIPVSAVTVTR